MAVRFDRAQIDDYEKLPDGRLRVRATVSRVGTLRYLKGDGGFQDELVTPEELFKVDSLDTAALAPVTLGHPSVGFVTPENYRQYAVGSTGSKVTARQDAGLVEVVFTVNDAEAIDAVESGKARQVSAGYSTKLKQREDGTLLQTDRRYNHFAIVPLGRAGDTVKLHFDSDDWAIQDSEQTEEIQSEETATPSIETEIPTQKNTDHETLSDSVGIDTLTPPITKEDKTNMVQWKGHEISKEVHDAINAELEALQTLKTKADAADTATAKVSELETKLSESQTELSKSQAKADTLQTEVDRLKSEIDARMDSAQLEKELQARLETWDIVKPYLGKDAKFDSADTVVAMKRKAIAAANSKLDLEGKNDAYIEAAFDTLQSLGVKPKAVEEAVKSDAAQHMDAVMAAAQQGGDHQGDTGSGDERADANALMMARKKRAERIAANGKRSAMEMK